MLHPPPGGILNRPAWLFKASRWWRVAADSRSNGALKLLPSSSWEERKDGAAGHSYPDHPKSSEGINRHLLRKGTSLLLGAVVVLLAASSSLANGGNGPPRILRDCPESEPATSMLDLERLTILIIKNNDALQNLHLSDLENLTTLTIRNNEEITELRVPKLHKLANITIENNDKLRDIELLEQESPFGREPVELAMGFSLWPFNRELSLIIKHNDCLKNLNLKNLNNLRELRIEGNDALKSINLHAQSLSNGETSSVILPLYSNGDRPREIDSTNRLNPLEIKPP